MANREISPFKPGNRAVLEWIRQDVYASALLPAAVLANTALFNAADANQGLLTNIEQPGQIAMPKVFRCLGVRVHVMEAATALDATGQSYYDLLAIINSLVFSWTIGSKQYLRQPVHSLPSGLGGYFSGTGAPAAATNVTYATANGVPAFNNFFKFGKKVITLMPGEQFSVQLISSAAVPPTLIVARRVYVYLVGSLGRGVS